MGLSRTFEEWWGVLADGLVDLGGLKKQGAGRVFGARTAAIDLILYFFQ